jgi:hypothetical protein
MVYFTTNIKMTITPKLKPIVNSNACSPLPAKELVLEARKSLLIVIAHYETHAVASHGLLSLRYDGSIDWTDTDGSERITSLLPRFKQMISRGLDVYLAYPHSNKVWWRYDIPVEPCDFVLGGGK